MFAGEDDAAIDLAKVVVVGGSRLIRPVARAPERERDPVPGDRNAILELGDILRMDLGAELHRAPDSLGRRHRGELVRVRSVEGVSAEQHALAAGIEIRARIGNLADREIGIADAAEDVLVLLPEPARELQPEFDRRRVGNGVDRRLHRRGHIDRELAQDGERQRAYAPVGFGLPNRSARSEVLECDRHAGFVLTDRNDFRAISNAIGDLPRERLADPAHAADGLEHGGLKVVGEEILQAPPKTRRQNVMQPDRRAVDRLGAEAAARILGVAAVIGRIFAGFVAEVLVECADGPQRLEQNLAIFRRHLVVKRPFPGRLGQELGDAAGEIGLDVPNALRLAVERGRRMQEGVVIELDERLERDPEPAAIIQDRVMMIGNPPRSRIDVEAGIELASLGRPAEFGVDVAASERPVASARTEVELEDADAISRALEFDRRRHSGEAGAQNDDRSPFRIAIELDRAPVRRFRREPKPGHDLVGRRPADARADELDQSSPVQ